MGKPSNNDKSKGTSKPVKHSIEKSASHFKSTEKKQKTSSFLSKTSSFPSKASDKFSKKAELEENEKKLKRGGFEAHEFDEMSDEGLDSDDSDELENFLGMNDDDDESDDDESVDEEVFAAVAKSKSSQNSKGKISTSDQGSSSKKGSSALVAGSVKASSVGYEPPMLGSKKNTANDLQNKSVKKQTRFATDEENEEEEEEDDEDEDMDSDDDDEENDGVPVRASSKKMQMFEEEEEEEEEDEEEEEEDEDDDHSHDGLDLDDFEGGDIEAAQRRLEQRRARVAAEAEADLRLTAQEQEPFYLPTAEELEEERSQPVDLGSLKRRVKDIVFVLTDFRNRRDPARARDEYISCLCRDLAELYGYNLELVELFMGLFSAAECVEFLEANETPRPVTIRTNTLKTTRRELVQMLINRGMSVEPVGPWTKVGLKVFETSVPTGATPEYLNGLYMLQSAASLVPVIALSPLPGERVLDVASAPGGKTSHIAQLMQNRGVLVANDLKKERMASLQANLARLGVRHAITTCLDGRLLPSISRGFDRVLLDAPCTGLGVLARDPASRLSKSRADVEKMSLLQKQLILAAVDACDAGSASGGYIVYSTCSVAVEENEMVVAYALKKRKVKIVPFVTDDGVEGGVGRPGLTAFSSGSFHPDMRHARRFYPHAHNMDGFFVCKLKKLQNEPLDGQLRRGDISQREHETAAAIKEAKAEQKLQQLYEREVERDMREEKRKQKELSYRQKYSHLAEAEDDEDMDVESPKQSNMKGSAIVAPKTIPVNTLKNSNVVKNIVKDTHLTGEEEVDISSTKKSTKNKRLPVEVSSAQEKEMMMNALSSSTSISKAKLVKKATKASEIVSSDEEDFARKRVGLKSMDSDDDEEFEKIDKPNQNVVSFLKEGEKMGKKKRKAGKKVREQRESAAAKKAAHAGKGSKDKSKN